MCVFFGNEICQKEYDVHVMMKIKMSQERGV